MSPGVSVAVVVPWDGHHEAWLAESLSSVDAQRPRPAQRCLVLDTADPDAALARLRAAGVEPAARGWTVRHGHWDDPAAARNVGTAATSAPWLVYWDADNPMPPGFLDAVGSVLRHAPAGLGILYSDIEYADADLRHRSRWRVPDWDYWALRASNYIDTASAWRREAVELAGGWVVGLGSFEDHALALEITRRGWTARRRPGPPIVMRRHAHGRAHRADLRRDLAGIRTLGVLTLLSGRRSTYERWEAFLHGALLPRHTTLHVVDNGGDPGFTRRVQATCADLSATGRFARVTLSPRPERYGGREDEPYFVRERHLHIARLYAETMAAAGEDLLLTLEDDVEPPLDAVPRLVEEMGCTAWGRHGAVAAAYDMGGDTLCAGRLGGPGWGGGIHWHEVGDEPVDVASVGGGCTLWANWALAGHPVPFRWDDGLGWDGSLCAALRARGYGVRLHAGVRAVHHVHGAVRA